MKVPIKYLPNRLTRKDKKKQAKQLRKSRKLYKKGKYFVRKPVKSFKSKPSNHVTRAKKIYNVESVLPNRELADKTGCSVEALEQIVNKGMGAMYSSGSRPNQTAHSWAYARLASAVTGGKSAAVDFHIIKNGCRKTGKAYKMALKAKKKHGRGTRKVRKVKI
jgi:hypothetical protein